MTSHMLPKISFLVKFNQKKKRERNVDVSLARPKSTNTPLNSKCYKNMRIIRTKKLEMTRKFQAFLGLFFCIFNTTHDNNDDDDRTKK